MSDSLERDGLMAQRAAALRSVAPEIPPFAEVEKMAARAIRMATVPVTGGARGTDWRKRALVSRPVVIALAAALLLGLIAAAAYAASLAISAARKGPAIAAIRLQAPIPVAPVDVQPIPTGSVPPASGTSTKPKPEATSLNAAQAIAAAGKAWGMNLTNPPVGVSVTARKMRFGDVRFGVSDSDMGDVAPKDALVWVVTVDGLSIPSTGGPAHPSSGTPAPAPKPHTQENIVINAKTGAFVMSCTYK